MSAILDRPLREGRRFQPSGREQQDTLTPLERLQALCDPGSLQLIRTEVLSSAMGDKARQGDGVLGGSGTVGGRPVFCYAQDPRVRRRLAGRGRTPTRSPRAGAGRAWPGSRWWASSRRAAPGCRRASRALGGYGRIFRRTVALSGKVPQISIVTGLSAGGGAYSPALTDWVVMTEESSMFLTGPGVVREALGEDVDAETARRRQAALQERGLPLRRPRRQRRRRAGARPARLPAQPQR